MKKFKFSNFLPLDEPFLYQGLIYQYVETFYVAMKTKDMNIRQKVSEMYPSRAKKFGRTIELREDWEDVKVKLMMFALGKKFAPGTSWRKKLDSTKGYIEETNYWHDNIWGNCICEKCNHVKGKNLLGKLLMEIRDNKRG